MFPDFNSKTIETAAKRAAYCCSNPDCGVTTVGPNADPQKVTTIGEAAHIHGARPDSARYQKGMSDTTRGEITNAIWLCRNCHKKIDRDPKKFPAELLFAWREEHEKKVAESLGNKSDLLRHKIITAEANEFKEYPPIIRRIVMDKPAGWEYRLTAELMRHLNRPLFRKLKDLREGCYTRSLEHLADEDVLEWVTLKLAEMETLVQPLEKLLDRLTESWGEPGEAGDIDEIHHTCRLIVEYLWQVVEHEERLRFARVAEPFEKLVTLLRDRIGSQADKLAAIPDRLEQIVEMAIDMPPDPNGEPKIITETITLELPAGWSEEFAREMRRAEHRLISDLDYDS